MKRLILVPVGTQYRVALAVYHAKGCFRIEMCLAEVQPYADAMATLARLKRRARPPVLSGIGQIVGNVVGL